MYYKAPTAKSKAPFSILLHKKPIFCFLAPQKAVKMPQLAPKLTNLKQKVKNMRKNLKKLFTNHVVCDTVKNGFLAHKTTVFRTSKRSK